MAKQTKNAPVPSPKVPHVPTYIPPHGEPMSGNPRQIHSVPPPPPTKK